MLIRTTYAGLCHSELHMWEGKFNLGGGQSLDSSEDQLPCVLGHEIEGEVLAAGDAVPAPPTSRWLSVRKIANLSYRLLYSRSNRR